MLLVSNIKNMGNNTNWNLNLITEHISESLQIPDVEANTIARAIYTDHINNVTDIQHSRVKFLPQHLQEKIVFDINGKRILHG